MEIKCNNYETKDIIKFMRDCSEKTQREFANDVNKKRGWCAKLEGGETNITLDTLIKLGLVNEHDGYINDIFKYRVMFPIHDLDGNVVGFTGRIYENNDQAKYINSKESVIFKKGQILFNYHRAKSEIKRKKEVILVEGNMDAIRMYSSGIKNVLALMGTSLTKEQVSIIKSLRANIILMFDNDNAGEIATYQNGTILEEAGLNPQIVRISGPKDPDEYIIKNGAHALMENIRSPISFLDFKLKYMEALKGEYTGSGTPYRFTDRLDPKEIVTALGDLLNRIRAGEVTAEQANRESTVIANLLKAYDTVEVKAKLDALEAIVGGSS